MNKESHTTIRNQNLFCLNCGGEHKIVYPIGISEMSELTNSFNILHKNCKPTWKEPQPEQINSAYQKAMFWQMHGERGSSSETMWNCLMGNTGFRVSHPYDCDDFSRCYKLLQFVPEWKKELHKLKKLSPQWEKLVGNWDKLTEMYEQNVKEDFKNWQKIGMGKFMEGLIK